MVNPFGKVPRSSSGVPSRRVQDENPAPDRFRNAGFGCQQTWNSGTWNVELRHFAFGPGATGAFGPTGAGGRSVGADGGSGGSVAGGRTVAEPGVAPGGTGP